MMEVQFCFYLLLTLNFIKVSFCIEPKSKPIGITQDPHAKPVFRTKVPPRKEPPRPSNRREIIPPIHDTVSDQQAHYIPEKYIPSPFPKKECRENDRMHSSSFREANASFHSDLKRFLGDAYSPLQLYTEEEEKKGNYNTSWRELFHSKGIETIVPLNLHFQSHSHRTITYFLWDLFLREDHIILIASRYLPIALQEIVIHVQNLPIGNQTIRNQYVCCGKIDNWLHFNMNEVIIGYYTSSLLQEYLVLHDEVLIILELYDIRYNYTLRRIKPLNEVLPTTRSTSLQVQGMKKKALAEPVVGKNALLVAVTFIGNDILPQEIITWLEYHLRIGVDYFYLYFTIPITTSFINSINAFITKYSPTKQLLTILQWNAYIFWQPRNVRKGCSQLGILQSALYRLRSSLPHHEPPLWIAAIDVDEYLIVHPQFHNLKEMILNYAPEIAAIEFHNSFFFIPPSHHRNDSSKTLLSGFTFEQFSTLPIVYERELKLHSYRPKLVIDSGKILLIGGHRVDLAVSSIGGGAGGGSVKYLMAGSSSFYLHFAKPEKRRGPPVVYHRMRSNLTTLLTLPRAVRAEEGISPWSSRGTEILQS